MEITAKKISKISLFKIIFIGFSISFFIFSFLLGLAALFGANTVIWNGAHVTGLAGFFIALKIWLTFSLVFVLFTWCFVAFGLWLYSFFKPLNLVFKEHVESN